MTFEVIPISILLLTIKDASGAAQTTGFTVTLNGLPSTIEGGTQHKFLNVPTTFMKQRLLVVDSTKTYVDLEDTLENLVKPADITLNGDTANIIIHNIKNTIATLTITD